jgi:hypothetical protein
MRDLWILFSVHGGSRTIFSIILFSRFHGMYIYMCAYANMNMYTNMYMNMNMNRNMNVMNIHNKELYADFLDF